MSNRFGGNWTDEKLERIRKYLTAYMRIFSRNVRARYFETIYVDAFAGTGYRQRGESSPEIGDLFREWSETETEAFIEGSANIALQTEPPFSHYLFVEKDPRNVEKLEGLRGRFPTLVERIEIVTADANLYLRDWCRSTDWRRHRAVVFLDPYGMQVEWSLIEEIARTRAIDLWVLFPLGVAVNRLLTSDKPPPDEWGQALDRIFGSTEWRECFYPSRERETLFERAETREKQADFKCIADFFVRRLEGVFSGVARNPLALLNSRNVPIYLLCFAVGNPRGVKAALRIAEHILRQRGGRTSRRKAR